ncbi:sushi, von Willebrand factor type A, EGF and pentraxin domain-containing protein 1-like isoform X1 [Stylophora pistillata]|uniref:sushi, von Willebrand factor type A, EGF and pentraxin domain-containing protein 1-like isoform X1 n=3 Tax=Stylophora pistillata TaxID=50429 RepID=UPI000C04FFA0|nr:sushi, von Willebrand factor type A, EGF and pentraxin domain-containing protein 1-like isoform X1 [Stylophora pistillata]
MCRPQNSMTVDLMWWIKLFSVLLIKRSTQINGAKLTLCSPPCLLVSNTSDIVAVDYGKVKVNSAIQGLTRAVAIDVHFSLGYIFWSDVTELNIKRFRIDVKSTTTVISNIGVCDGLAVQWRTSQLYWTDTTYNKISVSDLDGNNQLTLLSSALEEPRAIALDPDSDVMIWTDWGSTPKIEKASLSGQQRVAIVTKELFYPNGIDLDRGSKRIFWVDAGYDRVESVDYNGNNRKLLFQMYGLHPFGVALIPPFLFFTDWVTYREFHMLDATTGKVLRSFNINGGQPMGIVAYDSGRQSVASGPCAVNNGGCSHFCIPKASNHECVCPTGLVVKQDGKTCEEKVKKFILFADADGKSINIVSLDVNYFVAQTLFNHRGNQRPIALDYDPVEDRVYWSDIAQGLIVSAFINATSSKILFRCNILVPDGLAIDHVARNIYWTDTGNNRIEVARLDGTGRKALIASGLDEPRAILLDERNGMMYWTDWGAAPKVEKAAMDGSVRRSIVTGNLAWPNGLTLDQTTNRLYWADAKLDTIEMSDLDGGNRQIVLSSSAGIHPYGLTIYQDILYWTDWNNRSISSYNATSGEADMVIPDLQQPMDIHVFDPSLMFLGSHSCSQNNGMCSDLCLLKPGGYQCACPTGVALKVDGKNCDHDLFQKISSEHFLLFAEADHSEIYKVSLAVTNTPCYPLQININISRPVAVDYDPVEGKIYWTDVTLKLLARAFPNGSSVEVIAHTDVETPDGLVVDYIGRILYWTDTGTSKLEVARLDGSFRKSLITTGIESPRAIILDIARRQMYWSDWGSSPKIEQANMDGSSRKTIVSTGLVWVNALALDSHSNLLYWCDANLDKIERANLQGNNRELVLDLSSYNHHPFGLSLSDDTLYWSDWSNQSIHKYNLTSSQSEVLVYGMGRPMDVHVHDLTKVLIGSTSCSQVNGGCSHLCLPNPSGHQCFCPEGVQLKPGDALTCEGVNRCQQLHAPPHGSLEPCSNLPGQTCQFSCDKGYTLTGSTSRTCNSDGAWTGIPTQCNAVTCSALSEPSNGSRLGCAGTTIEYFNTVCSFFCHPGYDPIGSASRKCLENGTWSGQDFFCQVITCPTLLVPPKGVLLTSFCGNTYGSNCVFGCESGYGSLDGNITRTCLQNSVWSGDNINCTDILPPTFDVPCPASPLIAYAEREKFSAEVNWTVPTATDNSGLKAVINSNYHPPRIFRQGSYIITYSAVDQSGNKATCSFTIEVIVINCTSLVANPGSALRMSSCGNHYGARCEFSCANGYRLNGSSDVTCVTSDDRPPAVWDNLIPTCQSITCPSLPIPTNGGKKGCEDTVSELYDTLCSFYCNDGYSLVGSSARRCLENGTWSGETSLCLLITCSPLVPPTDVSISPSSCSSISNYGQTCRLTCSRPGYSPNGTSSRTCGRDGQWTGSNDTRCTDTTPPSFNNTCPKDMMVYTPECSSSALVGWIEPIADDNSGHVIVTYPSIRTSAQFRIGLYYITYSASDAEGNRANCTFVVQVTRKSCIKLQPPSHGNLSLSCGFSFGSQASFTCDRGYQLSGSRERLCKKDGSWSRNTTTCNVVKCRAIEPPSHGTVFPNQCRSASGVHYKTKCFLSCDDTPGYRLDGETVVSCLESGSWSADSTKTICKDVQPPSIQCPPNQELPTETGQAYAIVTWEIPVPSDNSNMSLSLKGLRPPQLFYAGRDYVRYEVTDSAGLSTSCTFSIHVKDVEPPVISCPDDIFLSTGNKDNMIFFPGLATSDNVGVFSIIPSRPNGSEFTWGEHHVTFTVTDKAGNVAECNFKVIITDESCPDLAPPENGAKACETWLAGVSCTVHCNKGYGFVNQPEDVYFCTPGGTWMNALENGQKALHFPDCSKTFKPKEAIVNGDLHYLIDECGNESVNEVIASNFIQLFQNSVFGKAGGCNGQCTIDNVEVDCGERGKRRRRETPSVPLTVRFALKVPLPANASLVDLNQTAELLSNNLLSTLNESDLNLNISGIVIEYDTSRPPHLRLASLICGKGQVQRGTQCVNCPLGFYFNDTGCHACPADQYQDQEAQSSCMLCPPGRVTIGKIGSKRRENCQEVSSMSSTDKQDGLKSVILYSSIAAGSLVFIVSLTIMAIFCAKKHPRAKHRTTPSRDIDLGYRNPVYEVAKDNPKVNEPVYMEIDVSKLPDRNGFPLDNNTDYFALSDIHQNDYERLEFTYSEA